MTCKRRDPGVPPPFPGRDQIRSRRGRGGSDWQQEYFGKRPDQSWADYFGLGPGSFRMGPDGRRASHEGWAGEMGTMREGEDNMGNTATPYRLWRSRTNSKIAGVCGGIAEYANVDAWIVRVGFIIGFFFFTPVVLFGYLILWWLLKERPAGLYESREEEVFWHSVATKPDQTLSSLRTKFRDLDREIGKLEGFVASREYDLHRQFRDLERK
ncbi:envelope stress response membrane protein PspC [Niveispirillum fermenti]|uniref:envelope stress response membrane protein PspC n=1 Tax=Niveispirillum fermenti TaxID=1233113 RepID=UPI00404192AB